MKQSRRTKIVRPRSKSVAIARIRDRNLFAKALKLLRHMLDTSKADWGVRELAKELNLPPPTAYRVLSHLEAEGLVQSTPDTGRYRIGLEFYRLAWRAQAQFPIRDSALPVMRDLVAQCNEGAFLGLYDQSRMEMMFVDVVEPKHPLRYIVPVNQWLPVYSGASGTAIMAFLARVDRLAIIERTGLAPVTERTITDSAALEAELARVRARGYACSHGQRTPGSVGIAAPIWDPNGQVIADLGITLPEQRFKREMESHLASLLVRSAERITERLGGRAPTQAEIDAL